MRSTMKIKANHPAHSGTSTGTTEATAPPAPVDEKEAAEDPDIEKIPKPAPPSRGLCRRCGEDKPINRLMLCYPCFVKTNLEEHGWREGQSHPEWCECTLPGKHSDSAGGERGAN